MEREFKTIPQHIKAIEGRTVTGIFSVFGVRDSYNDVVQPGAFKRTFEGRGGKALFLWQHDFASPPIAKIVSLRELPTDELPASVRDEFPEATGGAEVVREYLDTPRGNEVLAAIKAEVPLQMSFGFDAVKYEFEQLPDAQYDWEQIRLLKEVRLWECSDVLWGANAATVADASKQAALSIPLKVLVAQVNAHLEAIKEGRRNATGDLERIRTIAQLAVELGADNVKLLDADEEEDSDKSAKGKATIDRPDPEPVSTVPPLTLSRERLRLLELSI